MPEKMDLHSLDVGEENRTNLKQLFPSVFTETHDEKGELVDSIDFEKLKAELGTFSDIFEARRERYGMDWPGKKEALKLIQQPSVATLKPCREESTDFDATENLFIEGDNLEVLKLLQKSYYGKVKMIYIDPPFNTGKEFIYPDKYAESLETYLAYAGLIDNEGKKFATNTPNEGRFHTKWLNMMYPRLYLARNLLHEDGVIFISIDDNEITNLKKLCDDIFGEENIIDTIVWKKRYQGAKEKYHAAIHEYMLVYAKNKNNVPEFTISVTDEYERRYFKLKDERFYIRGGYRIQPLEAGKSMDPRPNLIYEIIAPDGSAVLPKRQWVWEEERALKALSNKELEFSEGRNGNWSIGFKQYLKDENGVIRRTKPFSIIDNVFTQDGTKEINELLGDNIFPFPKPSKLIRQLLDIATGDSDNNPLIVDIFAGSCPTAHAILELNKDGGNRKFIMVQLPEPCEESTEAFKAGYRNIADIGKERIRRVIKKIEEEQNNKAKEAKSKLPGIAEEQSEIDLGFKVLKLDKSNFRIWEGSDPDASEEEIVKQLEMHIDHISSTATQEDILFELLLKAGFMPTEKVDKLELASKTVFSIAEGALLICLEDEINSKLIDAVAEAEPLQFICLDRGFSGNDQLKANAVQTFAARNQGRDKAEQIVFRTV